MQLSVIPIGYRHLSDFVLLVHSTKILQILHMQVKNVRAFEPKLKIMKATAHIKY